MDRGSLNTPPHLLFLLLITLFTSPTALATEQLQQQADSYLRQQIKPLLTPADRYTIEINSVDSRLNIAPCAAPIAFDHPHPIAPGSYTLKASCSGPKRWSIYLSGTIEIYRPIVVSRLAIGRDTPLSSDMLALDERPISRLQGGYYTRTGALTGFITRRTVAAGQPLRASMLSPPLLVREGDKVTIQAQSQGLTVEAAGEALEDGRLDEQINVRNIRSERIIRARVTGLGQVSPP